MTILYPRKSIVTGIPEVETAIWQKHSVIDHINAKGD